MVTPKCELRSEPDYHLFAQRNRGAHSFRLRRVCPSGGIPIVSLSVYSLTSQQYIRFKDPVSDASKISILRRKQTLRPLRSAMSSPSKPATG